MASLYREASRVLEQVEKGKSVKQAAMGNASDSSNPRRSLALVSGVVSQRRALEKAMHKSGIWKELERVGQSQRSLALVAAYDLVAGQGLPKKRKAGGKLLRVLRTNEKQLRMEFKRNGGNVIEQKDANQENRRRRFARLNPLAGADLDTIKKQLDAHLIQDTHVPNLIEFPSSFATTLNASHSLVTCGHLILQDKSSCFPALALIGEKWSGGDILDCCAAPGNKSTHLAALIKGSKSRVIALDRDPQRFDVLKQRIIEARASDTIETRLFDCLALEPHHIPNVTAVLLDPSCSGSGIPGSSARTLKSERLAALASFQLTALTKFLTCFPAVDKVVYSTCSIHHVENEQVIAKALQATQGTFELVHCLPSWTRRGSATIDGLPEHLASRCLRVDPQFDAMTGFFVALFQRVKPSSNSLLLPPSLIFKQRQQEKRNMKRKLKRLKGRRARNIDTPTTTSSIPTTVPPPIETVTRKRRRTTKKKSADYDQDSGCSLVATKKRCLFSS